MRQHLVAHRPQLLAIFSSEFCETWMHLLIQSVKPAGGIGLGPRCVHLSEKPAGILEANLPGACLVEMSHESHGELTGGAEGCNTHKEQANMVARKATLCEAAKWRERDSRCCPPQKQTWNQHRIAQGPYKEHRLPVTPGQCCAKSILPFASWMYLFPLCRTTLEDWGSGNPNFEQP